MASGAMSQCLLKKVHHQAAFSKTSYSRPENRCKSIPFCNTARARFDSQNKINSETNGSLKLPRLYQST